MARARVIAHTGEDVGKSWEFEKEATIGRGSENTIRLKNGKVSTKHARIVFDAKTGAFVLEDLQSRNGTVLAGSTVRHPERLLPLDIVTLGGEVDLIFQQLPESAG